jgi:hypothetical protein
MSGLLGFHDPHGINTTYCFPTIVFTDFSQASEGNAWSFTCNAHSLTPELKKKSLLLFSSPSPFLSPREGLNLFMDNVQVLELTLPE